MCAAITASPRTARLAAITLLGLSATEPQAQRVRQSDRHPIDNGPPDELAIAHHQRNQLAALASHGSPGTKLTARAAVIQAARGLFLGRGYAATTIEAISDASDVPTATVYRLLPSELGRARAREADLHAPSPGPAIVRGWIILPRVTTERGAARL